MTNAARLVSRLVERTRASGYLAPDHALAAAGTLLEARPLTPVLAALGSALIRHAAIFDPFDRDTLRLARDVNHSLGHPPMGEWLDRAHQLTDAEPVPENIDLPDMQAASPDALIAYMQAQPANACRYPALLALWRLGARGQLLRAVEIMAASPSGLLAGPVLAWGAYGAGEPLLARMLLDESVPAFPGLNLRARLALDQGDMAAARQHLAASLDAEPFQPAVIEQLAELAESGPTAHPGPDTRICLYSWNKPDMLAQTVAALDRTDLGEARMTILNNGTTACQPDELERRVRTGAQRLAQTGRLEFVHLPVNVGAPAARNWLLSLPQVREARLVAFLDDDVLLPPHWLTRFAATLARHPEGVAVGAKCVNQGVRTIQYAFRTFHEIGERKIRLTPNAPTLMDLGQFDAARPCLTVMGCCHLFAMERLRRLRVPDFDVRFSPSQVDDIEHDLQIWKAGGQVLYDGGVEVVHLQDTGSARTRASLAQAYANHYKMEHKFDHSELARMDRAVIRADRLHFLRALDAVLPVLNSPAGTFWRMVRPLLLEALGE
ncbi:MAG: glycosyltransferase [Pseudodesulfovibrio sp.]|uniref:Glycosyl transferase family 2 n=1 Tax=Pseudodesulfovibrio aespoeensis (strain ATCC 700646 / DSM 10631 / Aspo-2) TaxID=643562 RepID=E6VTS4_PSEA9|nr:MULTISPECIES: glycosyltransferase [Pseudodesulfovibrio]MBU4191707.1 glycosyltransferase [Pseudomonadota bacterium]ADU63361.1 glycosyl transferase family 2 [Pseudodesulfovibrio aespoeensis Aspo-2]MBU4245205.1 glycosyltransferase [Pseudomonadota bacterium]MBU4379505.1 glycosyltransferase [Pseudomonadota bacterium]MBU4476034.1 glycosyltransferase [Pseudomonadota bacterium]